MSDLVDRYLGAVAALLPKAQRQDIVAELRDLILNRVEDLEAERGRPLDKREMEDLLREIGHPIAVAGRYGPARALVGPEIYPFWLFGVKALLAIAALAAVIPAGVALITAHGDARLVLRIVQDFIPTALSLIGAATLIAAAIERGWIKADGFRNWKVSDLPRVPDGKGLFLKSRFDGLFELVATSLFIAWWTGVVRFPIGPVIQSERGEVILAVSPVFRQLYWPILALALVQVVSSLSLVAKPGWTVVRNLAEIVGSVGGVALAWVLWRAQPLVTVLAPDASPAGLANLQRSLDLTFQVIIVVAIAIHLSKVIVHGWRLARGR
ncbi:HAAS signaling domain-containing protein [Caulobacter sp.]|uniref:HAAS signaling domain-containing protein n=1 Tax=Caulobacter sp. TaxID=78 RepID=UPI002B4798CD|nr:hypothetical protein [Caulobacter sp.]HJV40313.1 hypothetical protein [Caulobacter sp.]